MSHQLFAGSTISSAVQAVRPPHIMVTSTLHVVCDVVCVCFQGVHVFMVNF